MQIKRLNQHALYLFWTPGIAMHVQQMLEDGYGALTVQHDRYRWLHWLQGEQDSLHSEGDALFMTLETDTVEYAQWKLQEYLRTGSIFPAEFAELALNEKAAPPRRRDLSAYMSCYWLDAAEYDSAD